MQRISLRTQEKKSCCACGCDDQEGARMLRFVVHLFLLAAAPCSMAYPVVPYRYHGYENVTMRLKQLQLLYPDISTVYSIGKSVENRDLWVIAIGKQPRERVLLRPNVKLVANVHGNEATTKEILLHYAEHLLTNYKKDVGVSSLLNRTLVHILPLLNPDGLLRASVGECEGPGRENAKGKDLNRNFPDIFHEEYQPERQKETLAVMQWLHDIRFVLSASFHNGALLVSVPYDNYAGSMEDYSLLALSPDDDVFRELAAAYSFAHPEIHLQQELCDNYFHNGSLVNGIVNGADWYASNGTMQDYSYIFGSCMELTIEVGCCKYPKESSLQQLWLDNRGALLNFTWRVHAGVRGRVMDSSGKPLTDVSVMVDERMPVDVSDQGEFWKLLLPGNYSLMVLRRWKVIWEQDFLVEQGEPTVLNVRIEDGFSKRAANLSSLPHDYSAIKGYYSRHIAPVLSQSTALFTRRSVSAMTLTLLSLALIFVIT